MLKYLLNFIFLPLFFVACTHTSLELSPNRVEELSKLLDSLAQSIPPQEAKLLSREIFKETAKLRETFNPTSQAHFNNFLVNVGIKEQGLCYEWSDSLYLHFSSKNYTHFEFHLLVADQGKYFLEHNVMVVVAKGGKVLDGIIIDPWRNSGKLYFAKVSDDKKYVWKHREKRGCQNGK